MKNLLKKLIVLCAIALTGFSYAKTHDDSWRTEVNSERYRYEYYVQFAERTGLDTSALDRDITVSISNKGAYLARAELFYRLQDGQTIHQSHSAFAVLKTKTFEVPAGASEVYLYVSNHGVVLTFPVLTYFISNATVDEKGSPNEIGFEVSGTLYNPVWKIIK